ncbi:MAG: EamA family transporter [Oscillospiraceae bacterium]|nr:EamA family transporter [Oscillospiraceae bacterium]
MKALKNPKVMIIISMAVFGTIAPFVRNIPVSSGELALYRAVMAAILIGLFFVFTKQKIDFKAIKKELPLLLLSGIAMGINWILLFEAYKYTTVSVATLSYYFAPVIVTVVCPILFREKMTAKQILCFVMSTIGLVLVIGITDLGGGSQNGVGILFGLGAAVFYATVILLNKFIKGVAGIQRTFLQFIAAIIILIPYVAFTGGVSLGGVDTKGWICLLVVGIVHTGITYCLYFTSLKELSGQAAAILSYIDPLVAVIISVAVLGEPITWMQLVGGILILGFTLLNEIDIKLRKKS